MTPVDVLLAAIAGHLGDDVQPQLEGFIAYQNRIAINLLEMLRREVQQAGALARLDERIRERWALPREDMLGALTRGLRDGQVCVDESLLAALRERSLQRLAIDNPRYSGFRQACRRWSGLAANLDTE